MGKSRMGNLIHKRGTSAAQFDIDELLNDAENATQKFTQPDKQQQDSTPSAEESREEDKTEVSNLAKQQISNTESIKVTTEKKPIVREDLATLRVRKAYQKHIKQRAMQANTTMTELVEEMIEFYEQKHFQHASRKDQFPPTGYL